MATTFKSDSLGLDDFYSTSKAQENLSVTSGSRFFTRARISLGLVLLIVAGIGIGYPLWWNHRSQSGAATLIAKYRAQSNGGGAGPGRSLACTPHGGPGVLSIPTIGLVAPVQQGVDDSVLNVSVGHNPNTAWPGPNNGALLAAHDVSFFSRLSELNVGDVVSYTVSCGTFVFRVSQRQIATTGDNITIPPSGAVVLDTCWPTNALWFTPQRLIVTATYWKTEATATAPTVVAPASGTIAPVALQVNLPSALSPIALTLLTNSQLMGTMSFSGTPTSDFVQSNAPLQLEAAALTNWFAAIHTLEANRPSWWSYFARDVPFPTELRGTSIRSTSRLDVTESVTGTSITGITLAGNLNGLGVVAHESISGGFIYIDSYSVSP